MALCDLHNYFEVKYSKIVEVLFFYYFYFPQYSTVWYILHTELVVVDWIVFSTVIKVVLQVALIMVRVNTLSFKKGIFLRAANGPY